ncbi:MAG: hypothetical protein KAW02_00175 [candidate division Zixibacteria bacterium]|nr:hypothetical protein [candidate division Zixibacteria bacterium]
MKALESLWKETKVRFDELEKALIDCYITFMREVAKIYLEQGRKVFFKENRIVHWGEWNFGTLLIEGDEKVSEVFGDHISEIRFEPEIGEEVIKGYAEIRKENLQDIRYRL